MNRVRHGHGGRGRPPYIFRLRAEGCRPRSQVLKQQLLLAGEEAQLQPAEDVVHDRLGEADLGVVGPAARLEAGVREFLAQQLERHTMLQRDRHRQGEAVHEPADRRAFFCHGDENFARAAVGIEADRDVALVSADVELVRHRHALFRQLVPHRAWRTVQVLFNHCLCGAGALARLVSGRSSLRPGRRQRLRLLAAIAIDGHRLQPQLPGLKISLHDFFHGSRFRQIDRLRNRPGDERLRRRHHL